MSSFQETPAAQPSKLQQVIAKIAAGEKLDKIDLSNEGLVYFPEELFELSDTLEFLNMGGNKLSALPERIVEFKKLRIMFFAQNCFEEIPVQLGKMDSLFMLSFKSNRLKRVDPESLSPSVCWLILTDNQIEVLPSTIGRLLHLRKLMLAGNRLTSLPEELSSCKELELLRIAANQLPALPMWLLQMPCLSWLAYSGNPIAASAAEPLLPPVDIPWSQLQLGEVLGQGASGVVRRASWAEKPPCDESRYEGGDAVAVKLFRAGMTSDGLPEDEMKATEMVGNHPNFIGVLGRVVDAATGQAGLVLPQLSLDKYKILGNAPSFTTITRDTFPIGTDFSLAFIMRVLAGIAAACLHLHRNCGIMHGDLYAHNILTRAQHVRDHAEALLTDFGAASFVATGSAEAALLERIEIRAFGCLVEDMLDHHHLSTATSATATATSATSATSATASASATETDGAGGEFTAAESECVRGLAELLRDCKMESVEARPSFTTVVQRLAALQAATPSLLR